MPEEKRQPGPVFSLGFSFNCQIVWVNTHTTGHTLAAESVLD